MISLFGDLLSLLHILLHNQEESALLFQENNDFYQ